MSKRVLAFDFGASSGRAIIGSFDGERIALREVHRFSNDPVRVGDTLYWDVLRLFHEIKQGILKAKEAGGFDSIGIDTWGVDFGLLDADGRLLENPVHYRDARNDGMVDRAAALISREEMYAITGIQFMDFNTAFQLRALREKRSALLDRAEKLLFMPDLLTYFLTGNVICEYSIATTSQLIDLTDHNWSARMIQALELPAKILPEICLPGQVAGTLRADICAELGVPSVPVVAVCGHDTQSAICAVPSEQADFAFISSGTWSLFGTEIAAPIVNEKAMRFNVTNEGGFALSTAFLKNICGLWLIQESRRQWEREGTDYSFAQLEQAAKDAAPFACFIDPDAPDFAAPGNLPAKVRDYCRRTGQTAPESVGQVVRCIYESLAMKYRMVFEGICDCTEKDYGQIHVVGGGTKDRFLLQMTANSCAVPVVAGPVEATVLGNVSVQLIAAGELRDVAEARKIIRCGENLETYLPQETDAWTKAYQRFAAIVL